MENNENLEMINENLEPIAQNMTSEELVDVNMPMDGILPVEQQLNEEINDIQNIEETFIPEELLKGNQEINDQSVEKELDNIPSEFQDGEENSVSNESLNEQQEIEQIPNIEEQLVKNDEISNGDNDIELNSKVTTLNEQNEQVDVEAIRYFKYGNDYYLIFTYGEKDEKGNEKLYIVQVLEELGQKVTRNITDIDEWNNIQKMVKESIKQIKKGNDNNVEKLQIYELNEIKIESPRSFKIDSKLVELLKTDIVDDLPLNDNQNNSEDNSEYKVMYSALKEDHDATELLMDDLMEQLISYKEKYGELSE